MSQSNSALHRFTDVIHTLQACQACCQWRKDCLSEAKQLLSICWLCIILWTNTGWQFSGELYVIPVMLPLPW